MNLDLPTQVIWGLYVKVLQKKTVGMLILYSSEVQVVEFENVEWGSNSTALLTSHLLGKMRFEMVRGSSRVKSVFTLLKKSIEAL